MKSSILSPIFKYFSILALSLPASAAYISHYGYTLNTENNIVVGGGLEWLQWDETLGLSVDVALNTYSAEGWRLATNTEMAALLNEFNFGISFDSDESTSQSVVEPYSWYFQPGVEEASEHRNFISLFSDTYLAGGGYWSRVRNPLEYAYALFGEDYDSDGLYNLVKVADDYITGITVGKHDSNVGLYSDFRDSQYSDSYLGVALVRSSAVPLPAAAWLFISALAGLGAVRFRAGAC